MKGERTLGTDPVGRVGGKDVSAWDAPSIRGGKGAKMNGSCEETATLERMRAELVEAENALAKASSIAQRLGSGGTTEWDEGGIKPIRDSLSGLISNLDDRIVGPGD